jgi:hypothetical protein
VVVLLGLPWRTSWCLIHGWVTMASTIVFSFEPLTWRLPNRSAWLKVILTECAALHMLLLSGV